MSKRQLPQSDDVETSDLSFTGWSDYMEIKKRKLKKQFHEEKMRYRNEASTKNEIFKGVAIFVNGYTKPSADELRNIMLMYGGRYDQYYSRTRTTHIIATNLARVKVKQLKKDEKVVKPEWITDSVAAGKLLPCESYQLYFSAAKICFDKNKDESHKESKNDGVKSEGTSNVIPSKDLQDAVVPSTSRVIRDGTRTLRAGEDNFLQEFYGHSRLHHISTAGAKFKEYVNELRRNHDGNFPGRERLHNWKTAQGSVEGMVSFEPRDKIVMHLDMDCFFVSAGLRNRPDLKGLPVAVTHSRGGLAAKAVVRPAGSDIQYELNHYGTKYGKDGADFGSLSAVSSCNYEARISGVRNGMMLGEAIKICPGLQTIPYDFEAYEEISQILYDTVASYTLDVEAVSCDELFIDCTDILRETNATPLEFASRLREDVYQKTGCTASAGMAENVLLARLATKKVKPNGQICLEHVDVDAFMRPHSVKELPGVGHSLKQRLNGLGIETCEDLQKCSLEMLQKEFGPRTGLTLYQHSRGQEERDIRSNLERKSVSAEINYGIRFQRSQEVTKFLQELAEEVSRRLKNVQKKGRSISLKVKVRKKDAPVETAKFMGHGICDNVTRSTSLNVPTDVSTVIAAECVTLLKNSGICFSDLRGVGIQVGRLESNNSKGANIANYLKESGKRLSKSGNSNADTNHTVQWILPQASELDASVLNALPTEIQQEILKAYNIKEPSAAAADKLTKDITSGEANLCGATTLEDVKALLNEWVNSTDEPADEDVAMCVDYLLHLLVENLEKTDLLLKHFYRKINIKNVQDWKVAFSNVIDSVQSKMRETYGSDLKVEQF